MSRRDDLWHELAHLVGPLGPFTTPRQRRHAERELLAGLDASSLDDLLGILADVGDPRVPVPDRAGFESLLQDAVAAAGRDRGAEVVRRVVPLLDDPMVRPCAIDLLGLVPVDDAVAALDHLVRHTALTDDELERAACSLGELGGTRATATLAWLRDQDVVPSVAAEVDLALRAAAREGRG
ncbi:hypothetical protein IF650_18980 [Cellulosimicrobium terreum]|nr:hypothetical protein [Cellulosimicrobium terreum]